MNEPKFVTKLKRKWNIKSNQNFILIMLVFSLAGMAISVVRPVIFHVFKLDHAPTWLKVIVYIPLIPPIHQCGLLIFGFLLGQFDFFWDKEKQLAKFLLRPLTRSRAKNY